MRERAESVGGDDVVPLETHASFAFDVEAGLEGDDVAGYQGIVAVGDEIRRLRVAEPEAMARMAGEGVGEVQRIEVSADGRINGASTDAGFQAGLAGVKGARRTRRRAPAGERLVPRRRRTCW